MASFVPTGGLTRGGRQRFGVKIRFTTKGAREALAAINAVSKLFYPDAVQGALLPAGRYLRDDMRRRVKTGPGHFPKGKGGIHLRDAIFATRGKQGVRNIIIGVSSRRAPQAYWVEYGTAQHRLGKGSRGMTGTGAIHPGAKPFPFFRPAYRSRSNRRTVFQMVINNMKRLLKFGPEFFGQARLPSP